MMGYYNFGYGMGFGLLFMILFWVVFIWFIFWLIEQLRPAGKYSNNTPNEILKDRYAKGEITKKEYDRIKKELLH